MTRQALIFLLLVAIGCKRDPQPPTIPLTGIDPVVASQISNTVAEVKSAPRSGLAWGKLGLVLKSAGFSTEAYTCFVRAERLDPANPRWPYFQDNIDSLQRAVSRAAPDQTFVRLRLAQLLAEAGRWAEAEPHFRAAGHALGLAQVAAAQGNWEAAATRCQEARQSPYTARAATALLAAINMRSSRPEAWTLSEQAAAMPPDARWPNAFEAELKQYAIGKRAWIETAQDLLGQKNLPEAAPIIERLVTLYPDAAEGWLYLGRAQLLQSDLAGAELALARHLKLDPRSVDGHIQMGLVYSRQNRFPEAIGEFQQVLQAKPDSEHAHYFLGQIYRRQGNDAAATQSFREALRCDPNFQPAREALQKMVGAP